MFLVLAAHCTAKQNRVYVEIGRYNLDDISETFEIKISQSIVEHPQYVPDTAHADIAIIITSEMTLSNSKVVNYFYKMLRIQSLANKLYSI